VGGTPRASNIGERVAQGAAAAQGTQLANRIGAAQTALANQTANTQAAATAGANKLAAGETAFQTAQNAQATAQGVTRGAATQSLNTSLVGAEGRSLQAATQKSQNAIADLASEGRNQTEDVFQQFRQGSQELAFRKDAAQLEQVAQTMALSDKKYVDELINIGTMRRLDDANEWQAEMERLTLGDKLDDLLKGLDFKVDLNADKRTFDEQMATMSSDLALQILGTQIASANAKQTLEGVTGLAKAGASAYANRDKTEAADAETDAE
jgi:hypothetical protein